MAQKNWQKIATSEFENMEAEYKDNTWADLRNRVSRRR